MNTRSDWIRGSLLVALVVALLAVPEADAKGSRGGRSGGGGARAPRVSAPRGAYKVPTYKAPRMPRAAAPARANVTRARARTNNAQAVAPNAQAPATRAAMSATRRTASGTVHPATSALGNTTGTTSNRSAATATRSATSGTVHPATSALGNTTGTTSSSLSPNTYTYGSGSGARPYRAYGYGSGYRNRSYGGRSGYGRSQGDNRAIVSRLRSVHASLARIDHDYQGHRVRAMHAISMAIRQLSHRSMVYSGMGFAPGANNGAAVGMRRGGGGAGGAGARRGQPMPQAQSDARMSQALRTLQGIHMQLNSQGTSTTGHARARGHVQQAMHELNTALSIR